MSLGPFDYLAENALNDEWAARFQEELDRGATNTSEEDCFGCYARVRRAVMAKHVQKCPPARALVIKASITKESK